MADSGSNSLKGPSLINKSRTSIDKIELIPVETWNNLAYLAYFQPGDLGLRFINNSFELNTWICPNDLTV